MDAQKKEIEDLIAKTIRQIGHEKDMQDIETLRSFTANMKRKDGIRKFLIPITSIAAVFVLVFSLNIYHNNRIMNNMFVTYYTPWMLIIRSYTRMLYKNSMLCRVLTEIS